MLVHFNSQKDDTLHSCRDCQYVGERALLTPSHCARLMLGGGKSKSGVIRIIVQPSTKRIHHDAQYEDAGCEISEDLSECGLIIGIKQPQLEMILPDRAYAFFSHTHKGPEGEYSVVRYGIHYCGCAFLSRKWCAKLLVHIFQIMEVGVSLFDYELIADDDAKGMLAFAKFSGRAGLIDFLHGLGQCKNIIQFLIFLSL
uniref:Alanine dehydrogenase/pyridine nucleotide transhydrogenase N-terminal domain-containing protein n=1 Tax=Aegilops tauschii subsp. strangulata TaxID=200361 RepID=A0A453B300_AEGTS|nr:alpha-aminoadipic semialdehyde synthase isoform X1 [Aegilops tauschii subsp. strangulata]